MAQYASVIGATAFAMALSGTAVAQPTTPPPPEEAGGKHVTFEQLPPSIRLGLRSSFLKRQLSVIPTVVLVPDEGSYAAAIGQWSTTDSGGVRYPVLIDDGTFGAAQRIARFVRAFKPVSVVRWKAEGDQADWPAAAADRQARMERVVAAAWGADRPEDLDARWKQLGFVPPGVVVTNADDPEWTAALALAAGRGEPLVFVPHLPDVRVDGYIPLPTADAFQANITRALDGLGREYKALGDEIDAVTICMHLPPKVFLGEQDKQGMWALTDVIGRSSNGDRKRRWAWAGQIMGDAQQAAYDAMCGLFLQPESAWLFDGYDDTEPWSAFSMTKAGGVLEKAGFSVLVDDRPAGMGLSDLRQRDAGAAVAGEAGAPWAGPGVSADLISFNTSGNADYFDLKPGRGKPADAPVLRVPAMVYFVHSWSAAYPALRGTIAGAWLDRGVYAYVGSVHEPFLQGFVPTPVVMERLGSGLPLGAAVRFDDGPPWKIAVLGDPLITFGPAGPRNGDAKLPLTGAEDVAAGLPGLLKKGEFAAALRSLTLLGRDEDAARLVAALASDKPDALTPEVALAGIGAAFAAGNEAAFLVAAEKLLPILEDAKRVAHEGMAEVRDMVWQVLWPRMPNPTEQDAALLVGCLRPDNLVRDAAEAMGVAGRIGGPDAARAVYDRANLLVPDRETGDALSKLAP